MRLLNNFLIWTLRAKGHNMMVMTSTKQAPITWLSTVDYLYIYILHPQKRNTNTPHTIIRECTQPCRAKASTIAARYRHLRPSLYTGSNGAAPPPSDMIVGRCAPCSVDIDCLNYKYCVQHHPTSAKSRPARNICVLIRRGSSEALYARDITRVPARARSR